MGDMRALLLALRQSMLIILGAIEDYLGMPRSVVPKHIRKEAQQDGAAEPY